MADQLDMFDQMGLGWPPVKVAAEWIRDGWCYNLEHKADELPDYADEPDWPEREETFDGYVRDHFRSRSGWWGIRDFHGYKGIEFSPRGCELTRPDNTTEAVTKAEILKFLGVKDVGQ